VGYAYVGLFRKRPAYRFAVKHLIYVHHEHISHNVGGLLMIDRYRQNNAAV
jgi:L-amino acid N-acyltransferase YncA